MLLYIQGLIIKRRFNLHAKKKKEYEERGINFNIENCLHERDYTGVALINWMINEHFYGF